MLSVNQLDFINYRNLFKGNYDKGKKAFDSMLHTRQQAMDWAKNLGGVSVVLGVDTNADVNSAYLLTALNNSGDMELIDTAVETWLHGVYEFTDLSDLFDNELLMAAMEDENSIVRRNVFYTDRVFTAYIDKVIGVSYDTYPNIATFAGSDIASTAFVRTDFGRNLVLNNHTLKIVAIHNLFDYEQFSLAYANADYAEEDAATHISHMLSATYTYGMPFTHEVFCDVVVNNTTVFTQACEGSATFLLNAMRGDYSSIIDAYITSPENMNRLIGNEASKNELKNGFNRGYNSNDYYAYNRHKARMLKALGDNHLIDKVYELGDNFYLYTGTYNYRYNNSTGAYVYDTGLYPRAKVVGFYHDDKADGTGKAGMTIGCFGVNTPHTMAYCSNANNVKWSLSNVRLYYGGYKTSGSYAANNSYGIFYGLFGGTNIEYCNYITPVIKKSYSYSDAAYEETVDCIFTPSLKEINGSGTIDDGEQYEYYKTKALYLYDRSYPYNNSNAHAWTRTPANASYMYTINGGAIQTNNPPTGNNATLNLALHFCI